MTIVNTLLEVTAAAECANLAGGGAVGVVASTERAEAPSSVGTSETSDFHQGFADRLQCCHRASARGQDQQAAAGMLSIEATEAKYRASFWANNRRV